MSEFALGLIETAGLVGAIEATDAASKAAAVVVTAAELTPGTLVTIKIEGELGAVQAAVSAGARAAERVGRLVAAHVIPNPDDGLEPMFPPRRFVSKYRPDDDRPRLSPVSTRQLQPTRPVGARPTSGARRSGEVVTVPSKPGKPAQVDDLTKMTVFELRRFARSLTRVPMAGRQISKANKKQLIDAIRSVIDMD